MTKIKLNKDGKSYPCDLCTVESALRLSHFSNTAHCGQESIEKKLDSIQVDDVKLSRIEETLRQMIIRIIRL
jgi:hypothetical protein